MRRQLRLAAVVGLLVLAAAVAGFATPGISELDTGRPVLRPPELVVPPLEDPDRSIPEEDRPDEPRLRWLGDVVVVLVLVAAVTGLVVLARVLARKLRGRRGRGRSARLRSLDPLAGAAGPGAPAGQAPLLAAVDAGLRDLSDDDRDPRRAVIACWVRLEEAAAAAGVPRLGSDTAGDLVVRLLRARNVSEPALAGLADAYRLARFATGHTVDTDMRDQARGALRRLHAELLHPQLRS